MGRRANEAIREMWRQRLTRFDSQRDTVAQFCRRERVSVPSFYHWRRKLGVGNPQGTRRGRPRTATESTRPSEGDTSRSPAAVRFVPVAVAGGSARPASCVEVLLPSGVQVRVPCDEPMALQLVLAMLRQPSENRPC